MDLNPFDDIKDAASDAYNTTMKKKRRLVRYIAGKTRPKKDAPIRGTSDKRPKYYR